MAAGLGKRMRPLTATRPKPLVEVAGKPLIDHVLDRLRAAGVKRAVVNVHYLADALEAHLKHAREGHRDRRSPTSATQLLETGGGMVKALPLIDADPFLVRQQRQSLGRRPGRRARAARRRAGTTSGWTRCCCSCRSRAPIAIAAGAISTWTRPGALTPPQPGRVAPFVFTGIQIVSKRLFAASCRRGRSRPTSSGTARSRTGALFGAVHQGLWFDVGTPPAASRKTEAMLRAASGLEAAA